MKTSVIHAIRIRNAARDELWHSAALLLAIAITAHYLAMSSPALHDRLMVMPVATMEHHDGGTGTDSNSIPESCACSCPVIEAIFP